MDAGKAGIRVLPLLRFPPQSETVSYTIERLQAAGTIGAHPGFAAEQGYTNVI